MSAEQIHSGPSCPCGDNCCHWSYRHSGVDLSCSATAEPGTHWCDRHTPPDKEPAA